MTLGLGFGGGAMVEGLLLSIGVLDVFTCWEEPLCDLESTLREGCSVDSKGDFKTEAAIGCWKYGVLDVSVDADAGGVMYDPDALMVGNV